MANQNTIADLSTTPASNLNFQGQNMRGTALASTIDSMFQNLSAMLAGFYQDQGGVNTTGGSANAQTVTLSEPIATTVPTGFFFTVKFGYSNTSTTVTLNVNSIGAKSVKVFRGSALADPAVGDLQADNYGRFLYDGTYFVLLTSSFSGSLVSTDAGATAGPTLDLYRNSASPAANDVIGRTQHSGQTSTGAVISYSSDQTVILDPTNGSEDARRDFYAYISGSAVKVASMGPSLVGRGTPTNDSASSGDIGEYVESVVSGSPVSLTSNTGANMTSISLTAGDWDVDAVFVFSGGATTTVTYWFGCISLTSATIDQSNGRFVALPNTSANPYNSVPTGLVALPVPPMRFSLSATTTIYAVAQSLFGTSTANVRGILRARRVR